MTGLAGAAYLAGDPDRDLLDAVHAAVQLVAALQESHAGRGAGEDQVARLQDVQLREIGDDVRHGPDHLLQVALLAHLAVHLQPDPSGARVADLGSRADGADRRRLVERLARLPGASFLLGGGLQIAARQIEADRIAEDVLEGGLALHAGSALPDRHHQLHLVRQLLRERRVGDVAALRHDRVGRLGEEEGRLAVGVAAHLAGVLGVVASHAVDAPDREHGVGAAHGQRGQVPGRDHVAGHQATTSSRQSPSAFCTGRSEKLNSTASSLVWCETVLQDGATKTSRGPHSKVWSPTTLRPPPSTTAYTVPSVDRYGLPRNPAGRSWMNAAMVGIG